MLIHYSVMKIILSVNEALDSWIVCNVVVMGYSQENISLSLTVGKHAGSNL